MDDRDVSIIKNLLVELENSLENGNGPFMAAIYDENYNLIAKAQNTVVKENSSICHAEINAVIKAEKLLKTYNLAPYNLGIYITSEPCIMCLGAIMWSGIKRVYYSASSKKVEEITGFDEGFKKNWQQEFKKRGIIVYPDILEELGAGVLEKYVNTGGIIYSPKS
ncbi:MAG: nucleoside deaminase [Candidatus Gastranaerophilales bacterium]|nr:nucleoside deaminase [Candidatus Gastranaerophilales bacterium]